MLHRFTAPHSHNTNDHDKPVAARGSSSEMALRRNVAAEPASEARTDQTLQSQDGRYLEAKVRLHRRLIEEINLTAIEKLPPNELQQQVRELVTEYVRSERLPLNAHELHNFSLELYNEMMGLGPIEPLLKDPTVTDILINTH